MTTGTRFTHGIPCRRNILAPAFILSATLAGGAWADPPMQNSLGARFSLLSSGPTSTVQIQLRPVQGFDTVHVEAGSGAHLLPPACAFTDVAPPSTYTCKVNVQFTGEASLTLNVVAEKTVTSGYPKVVEVHHFTIANSSFVAPAGIKQEARPIPPAQTLILTPPSDGTNP